MARGRKITNEEQDIMMDIELSAQDNPGKVQKRTVTINLEQDTIDYFKRVAVKMGLPYQTLINLCLNDVRDRELVPQLHWSNQE